MKTLTIPKRFGYPTLDVTVNGKEYTIKSGEEITVEDHIAEAIENAIALAPKFGVSRNKLAQLAEGSLDKITESDLDGITKIAGYAFYNLKSLTDVIINSGITAIKECAFFGCSNLKSVRLGDNSKLESIGTNVFDWCAKLVEVYLPETPPTLSDINAFQNINTACTFYCKTQESLEAYRSATNWSTLAETYTFAVQ